MILNLALNQANKLREQTFMQRAIGSGQSIDFKI